MTKASVRKDTKKNMQRLHNLFQYAQVRLYNFAAQVAIQYSSELNGTLFTEFSDQEKLVIQAIIASKNTGRRENENKD